jgi:hypothetical protein
MSNDQEQVERMIEDLRAGKIIKGHTWYEHGLQSPLVGYSQMHLEGGSFIYRTWLEEPVLPVVEFNVETKILDEAGARQALMLDSKLREQFVRDKRE